ncbi:S41 family peptidase [Bacteroidales bacterium]|nr:S41 family peptidase [Bacteroidales bacterium]
MGVQNSKRQIITPLIISISIIIGMMIGMRIQPVAKDDRFVIVPRTDKLNGVVNYIVSDYVDSINKDEMVEDMIPKILEDLDPHSVYIPAKDLTAVNEPLEGNFSGIGVQFNMQNDTVAIIKTIPNGPSEKVGILAGDRITIVDGDTVAGKKMGSDKIVKMLKGPRGTHVNVGIKRRGVDETLFFDIVRDNIPLYSVDVSYMVSDNTGFIKISKFARTTMQEFVKAVTDLKNQNATNLIIDLRDNGGGLLDQATQMADQFFSGNELLVYTQGNARPRQEIRASNRGLCADMKIVVLMNEWSASASEIIAGAIQDNDRGLIIGRRSFGKGLVQETKMLNDRSALRLTIARYYTPAGRCIQKSYENGHGDYYKDLSERYLHGEFLDSDSIDFADSLKYYTANGKVVYGGGGIMPDVFVPMDTVGMTSFYMTVRNKGLIYKFAFNYTDDHRSDLKDLVAVDEIIDYLDHNFDIKDFIRYAKSQKVIPSKEDLTKSESLLKTQIYAYIARNVIDNDGFYPIIQSIDQTLQVALDKIEEE